MDDEEEEDTDEYPNMINFQTNNTNEKIGQNLLSKFNISSIKKPHNNKLINKTYKSILNPNPKQYLTNDPIYIEDFLNSIRIRFDDVFKKIEEDEKSYQETSEENSSCDDIIKGAVYLRKLNFHENFRKIDVKKVIQIQKIIKGYIVRNIDEKSNRLRARQCLIELFCLLIYGFWYKAKLRYYISLMEHIFKMYRTVYTDELNLGDKLALKLPRIFYCGSKINNLSSSFLGKERKLKYNKEMNN